MHGKHNFAKVFENLGDRFENNFVESSK